MVAIELLAVGLWRHDVNWFRYDSTFVMINLFYLHLAQNELKIEY